MNRERARVLVRDRFLESSAMIRRLGEDHADFVVEAAEIVQTSLRSGGTLFSCGNGGSAADAQHIAAELAGRFYLDRSGLAASSLSVNTSALTAIGNDFGFDEVFARQLEGPARAGDVLLAITTSGNSVNVLRAVEKARELDMKVIGLTGSGGERFASACHCALMVPSNDVARIQEGHICAGHLICHLVEAAIFGDDD